MALLRALREGVCWLVWGFMCVLFGAKRDAGETVGGSDVELGSETAGIDVQRFENLNDVLSADGPILSP